MHTKRIIPIIILSMILGAAMLCHAADWYVVKHKSGATTVVDYKPGPDWSIVDGPFKTKDEATRASGVDPNKEKMKPQPAEKEDMAKGDNKWYVVKHKSGATTVVDYKPGPDWSIVGGPFKTKDEAARASGIDPNKEKMKPQPAEKEDMAKGDNEWYVVKHKSGATTVVDYKPGPDWSIVDGPFKTKDEATRASGVDPNKEKMKPQPAE